MTTKEQHEVSKRIQALAEHVEREQRAIFAMLNTEQAKPEWLFNAVEVNDTEKAFHGMLENLSHLFDKWRKPEMRSSRERGSLLRKVRKALGYTYP